MDRKKFEKLFNLDTSKDPNMKTSYNSKEVDDIIKTSLMRDGFDMKKIISIEELSELQKELTKSLRNNELFDFYGMLEEIADVYICLRNLQFIFDYSDLDINRAIDIKLWRLAHEDPEDFVKWEEDC